jgi:hypothetical protein
VCKELGEYSAVSPKSELGFLCALDSAVHQELWILLFSQGVSPDSVECQIGSGEQREALEDK